MQTPRLRQLLFLVPIAILVLFFLPNLSNNTNGSRDAERELLGMYNKDEKPAAYLANYNKIDRPKQRKRGWGGLVLNNAATDPMYLRTDPGWTHYRDGTDTMYADYSVHQLPAPTVPDAQHSPIVVDHIHFEDEKHRAGWANVHAMYNGHLVSGQMRLVRKARDPTLDIDVDDPSVKDAIQGLISNVVSSAFNEVLSPPQPQEGEGAGTSGSTQGKGGGAGVETQGGRRGAGTGEGGAGGGAGVPGGSGGEGEGGRAGGESEGTGGEKGKEGGEGASSASTTPAPETSKGRTSSSTSSSGSASSECKIRTVKGCCCDLPFEQGGKTHDQCISDGHTAPWCYTQDKDGEGCGEERGSTIVSSRIDEKHKGEQMFTPMHPDGNDWVKAEEGAKRWWDHCEKPQVETPAGCKCLFPFTYKGKEHNICIWDDSSTPWCETDGDQCGRGPFDPEGIDHATPSSHWWDYCLQPPPAMEAQHQVMQHHLPSSFIPENMGRHCGDTKSHWLEPWHFNDMCASGVCNYRCKNPLYCPDCDGENCKCVDVKDSGESCGDGTNRPPKYSHLECRSGKCVYKCWFCRNCNDGGCICA